jgi:nitroimidazol reductase NimA-like FMN-containing flavoprotein (pyridoxamine 5'-phosphate oxidase superfamily)
MRRQDRKISDGETMEILRKGEFGILSMITNNGGYGIPLNFALKNNEIYFHCAIEGSKLDYLRNNNKVSFCVVGNTEVLPSKFGTMYESAIAFGSVTEVEGEEKHDALILIIEKYSGDYIHEGKEYIDKFYDKVKVIKLSIESISGKSRK